MTPGWRSPGIRASLTAWYVIAMVVVLAIYATAVFGFVSRSLSDALDARLRVEFQLAGAMVSQDADGSLLWFEDDRNGGQYSRWLQVWKDGMRIFSTGVAERNPIPTSDQLASRADERIVATSTDGRRVRILSGPMNLFGQTVVVQVAAPETEMRAQLWQLFLMLGFGLPLGAAVAGVGGYWLARRALAPVETMAERARTITVESLSDRLPVDNPDDELGHLATVFNETLGRLESSFDQMRRFTADVSHELRTPLTAIRTVGEVGLRERRDPDAYRAIIGSMLEEVDRLGGLVDRLLTLSRAEIGQARLTPEPVDLRALADDVVAQIGVLAEEKRQAIHVESVGTPFGMADRTVLRQAVINLVDNAIKYTPAGGKIRLRASESPVSAFLEVSDNGPGVAADVRSRIFDRFYRAGGAAPGRHDVGGSGLGLAIAKWAVEANGGQLSLEPNDGSGTTFRITIARGEPRGQERRRTA